MLWLSARLQLARRCAREGGTSAPRWAAACDPPLDMAPDKLTLDSRVTRAVRTSIASEPHDASAMTPKAR